MPTTLSLFNATAVERIGVAGDIVDRAFCRVAYFDAALHRM